MADRTLHLIVTDYDLKGFVRKYHLDDLWTPKLVKAVDKLKLEADKSAICYSLFSDETLEEMDNADIFSIDIWKYRAEEFSYALRRPEDHFVFEYAQRRGLGVYGAIPWACRTNNLELVRDSINQFHQILEGQRELLLVKVGAVIDCTDHPLMQPLLEGMGYKVKRQEVFHDGPWPERK